MKKVITSVLVFAGIALTSMAQKDTVTTPTPKKASPEKADTVKLKRTGSLRNSNVIMLASAQQDTSRNKTKPANPGTNNSGGGTNSGTKPNGSTTPGTTNPAGTNPGNTNPGNTNPGGTKPTTPTTPGPGSFNQLFIKSESASA